MNSFVFIFRRGIRSLTEQEQEQRTADVRSWALQQIKDHSLDPRVLDEESHLLNDLPRIMNNEEAVIALTFIEAKDFNEAVALANTHPGLRYGVSIEVRRWTSPRSRQA